MDSSGLPDLRGGIDVLAMGDGAIVACRIDAEKAILIRSADEFFAVGAECTHYHGALASGLTVDDTIRCPLHHACFSLRTGAALRAPALDPIACWRVERIGNRVFARERLPEPPASAPAARAPKSLPASVTIIGGGAAGLAAADALRREGYTAPIALLSADDAAPCDRPNLSKDFLMGTAPAEWMPLRGAGYYAERNIELLLDTRVTSLDIEQRILQLDRGGKRSFDSLLMATGADPVRLNTPTSGDARLFYLRSFDDSRAIVAAAAGAQRVVVAGASFIGLEVAAPRCARGTSKYMSSGPKTFLSNGFWVRRSAPSCAMFISSTVWCFTWGLPLRESTPGGSRSATPARLKPISSFSGSVCVLLCSLRSRQD